MLIFFSTFLGKWRATTEKQEDGSITSKQIRGLATEMKIKRVKLEWTLMVYCCVKRFYFFILLYMKTEHLKDLSWGKGDTLSPKETKGNITDDMNEWEAFCDLSRSSDGSKSSFKLDTTSTLCRFSSKCLLKCGIKNLKSLRKCCFTFLLGLISSTKVVY